MRLEFEVFERLREAISTARRNDDDVRLSVELADELLLTIDVLTGVPDNDGTDPE